MPAPLLEVDGLSILVGSGVAERAIVRDVDFGVGRGESVALVGESGSGKSLTARAIAGLLPDGLRATGSVRFDAEELVGAPESGLERLRGKRASLLFQDPFTMLNPLMRCGEHIAEGLRRHAGLRRGSALRAEVQRRLEEVGIDDPRVARRYPFELSGGLRQRIGLAAALSGDPELLIADEPSTALDVTTQSEIVALLERAREARGMGLLLITHDLRLAFSACERVLVLYGGALLEAGTTAEVHDAPAHPYTLGLLMSEPPVERRLARLYAMPGAVPAPGAVAGQCAFAPRCDWVRPECRDGQPSRVPVEAPARPGAGAAREREGGTRDSSATHASACRRLHDIRDDLRDRRAEASAVVAPPSAPGRCERARVVTVSGLAKSFGKGVQRMQALRGVDLHVDEGECVALVGESGSGKTTLGRCLLGLESADDGAITIDGLDARAARRDGGAVRDRLRRRIQIVFQDPYSTLNPAHTVRRCLHETLRAARAADAHAVEPLLARVGLAPHYADARPAQLSGGERQRVAIARALAVEPGIIVFDEPVSALDVSVQAQVLNLLAGLKPGVASLFISHDLAVVRQVADRVYVLYRGEIVEEGDAEQVLGAPRHAYTRRLLESVPTGRAMRA